MPGLWYYSLALAFLEISTAYWLMAPNNILTTQRLDPVVSPGSVATHVHGVVGGSNFGLNTSTAALRDSSCSSIPLIGDFSNYCNCISSASPLSSIFIRRSQTVFFFSDGPTARLRGTLALSIGCFFANMYPQRCRESCHVSQSAPYHPRRLITDCRCSASASSRARNLIQVRLDYLFNNTPGATTAFPDDFRMLSGDPTLRTLNASSFAQQAVTFLCLDFNGQSPRFNELPRGRSCPSGIRSQINFPSCWNGKDADSPDHKSHVTWLSTGPDNGTCTDENFPVTLPRIFMEVYWISQVFEDQRGEAMTPSQPFVYVDSGGARWMWISACLAGFRTAVGAFLRDARKPGNRPDPTGYGYHADFFNGWNAGLLQSALDGCNCNPYGDPTCCVSAGIFSMNQSSNCFISDTVDEQKKNFYSARDAGNITRKQSCTRYIYLHVQPKLLNLPSSMYAFNAPLRY
ncbi:RNA-directed DNA polymerase from transposon X-element [Mycena chlorophos]|uniref:RNA-directed DNA polymerase from transposon X-element n=1 Tax=Mycena chlorophos TaxID=658473 RepID=A0A8H6TQS0_MYCCL|nr:RNA-directed DNA polymerase from transposon X-element [Mycena chlorophos]